MSKLKDGNYEGSAKGHNGEIVVSVKIQEGVVSSVDVLKQHEDAGIGGEALPKLKNEILKKNSYIVDAVSGATMTSNGLKSAVKEALDKAK